MSTVKQTVKSLLPDSAVRSVQSYLFRRAQQREAKPQPLDLAPAELIREASLSDLRDPSYLELELLPRLGLNDELLYQFPRSLHRHTGFGLRHWQYPNQFAKYLVTLSGLELESYLEIGIRHGGTFVITVEYLNRFHPLREAVGVDLGRPSAAMRRYAASRPGITLLQADSHGPRFEAFIRDHDPFDLILIDGDHSEEGCRQDFEVTSEKGRAFVFHDIVSEPVPGVGRVWEEVKRSHAESHDFLEFTDQYDELKDEAGVDYLGIGLALPKDMSR